MQYSRFTKEIKKKIKISSSFSFKIKNNLQLEEIKMQIFQSPMTHSSLNKTQKFYSKIVYSL